MRRVPSENEIQDARDRLRELQRGERPRGMPPENGLHYQPIPLPGFEGLAAERDGSPARLELLTAQLELPGRRVLDLGCANGFFLFSLAQLAPPIAAGLGVDHFAGNVAGNRMLAELFGFDELEFLEAGIDDALLDRVLARPWDVVLLLSVHHHLARSLGIEATRQLIRRLIDAAPVVVIEQGSLMQEEYRAWTGRDEPFDTRAFSRLVSMLEACGARERDCVPLGEGLYLSGRRPDADGSGRAMVAHVRDSGVLAGVHRKRHRNGIYMELLDLAVGPSGAPEWWKNIVMGDSLARRERRALGQLAITGLVPRVLGSSSDPRGSDPHLIRMERRYLQPIDELGPAARRRAGEALIDALQILAQEGVVHHELSSEHVQWDRTRQQLCILDWETVRFRNESLEGWRSEVADGNPALGLGMYERKLLDTAPDLCDLEAARKLLDRWGVPALSDDARDRYLRALNGSDGGSET